MTDEHEERNNREKEAVYRDRNLLAAAFVEQKFVHDNADAGWWDHSDDDDDDGESDYVIVWCDLYPDLAQVGWHIPREMVPDSIPERDPYYDGYTRAQKNNRMAWYLNLDEADINELGLS